MLAPPKSLIGLGASLLTLRAAQRLRRRGTALVEQERAFRGLMTALGGTAFGREHGLSERTTYPQFQQRVGLRTYEQFVPYIQRMKQGERNVLWPGGCSWFARTAGTCAAQPKHLPITDAMLAHFRRAGFQAMLNYTARVGHAGVFRGRHLYLAGSSTLEAVQPGGYVGEVSGMMLLNLPRWADTHLHEPGKEIGQMNDWSAKLDAIVQRTRGVDITAIAGSPTALVALAERIRQQAPRGDPRGLGLSAVWPNLECLIHAGLPMGPYAEELRQAVGPKVIFQEVYPASEGFIAAQDAEAAAGLRLLTDAGVFFEFLPLTDYHEARLPTLHSKLVPLAGVQIGVDYALVLTTPAGLCRYVLGDVVRFVSIDPPRLIYVGRTSLHLSALGEFLGERELTEALVTTCQRHAWRIVNFHVAPLETRNPVGHGKGRHEWWVELRPHTLETPTGPALAGEIDAELQRTSESYRSRRRTGAIEAPVVRLVMPGVFEQWLRENHRWGPQHKVPRCRSDRAVAEGLNRLSPFC